MRNRYSFTKDDHCISLFRITKVKDPESKNFGQDTETLIGHYSNIEQLLRKLFHLELIDKGDLNILLEDSFKVKQELDEWARQFGWGNIK